MTINIDRCLRVSSLMRLKTGAFQVVHSYPVLHSSAFLPNSGFHLKYFLPVVRTLCFPFRFRSGFLANVHFKTFPSVGSRPMFLSFRLGFLANAAVTSRPFRLLIHTPCFLFSQLSPQGFPSVDSAPMFSTLISSPTRLSPQDWLVFTHVGSYPLCALRFSSVRFPRLCGFLLKIPVFVFHLSILTPLSSLFN